MAEFQESAAHKARRHDVLVIESKVWRFAASQIEPDDLKKLQTQVLPMSLGSNGKESFFKPFANNIIDPDDEVMEHDYPSIDVPDDFDMTPIQWAYGIVNYVLSYITTAISLNDDLDMEHWPKQPNAKVTTLHESKKYREDWRATDVTFTPGYPHYKCLMLNNIDGDDRLTRGELLCICRIMVRRLNVASYIDHMIVPVMLLSFMGPRHGRILQAHYNGTSLVVRKSKLFDLRSKDVDALKLFARWWCASPVGDTISP